MGRPMAESLLASQRRQRILDALRSRGMVKTGELARTFGVSEMTIHRDLDALAAQGLVQKIFGGAVTTRLDESGAGCTICGAAPDKRLDVTLHLANGGSRLACCPHCGLMLLGRLGEQVQSAVTFDFVTRQTVNVRTATYVLESAATPCCSPSVLAFRMREDAERFRLGFGGRVADLEAAMAWLARSMGIGFVPVDQLSELSPGRPRR